MRHQTGCRLRFFTPLLFGTLSAVFLFALLHWASFKQVSASVSASPLDVVIHEISWMGTTGSANDEWLEIFQI